MFEIDFNFMAGFVLGMITCGMSVSALVFWACLVVGKRADETIENQELTRLFVPKVNRRWKS